MALVLMGNILRAVLVHVVGFGLVVFGIAGLALPLHPGLLFIALGLLVLAQEARWAQRLYARFGQRLVDAEVEDERLRRWQRRVRGWLPDPPDEAAHAQEDGTDQAPGIPEGEDEG